MVNISPPLPINNIAIPHAGPAKHFNELVEKDGWMKGEGTFPGQGPEVYRYGIAFVEAHVTKVVVSFSIGYFGSNLLEVLFAFMSKSKKNQLLD